MTDLPGEEEAVALPRDEEGPVFAEPWQARAFAIVVKMFDQRHYTWPEWVDRFSAEIAAPGHYRRPESSAGVTAEKLAGDANRVDKHYFEHWLAACEKLLVAKGVMTKEELDDRASALAAAESPAPRFARGDRIVVRDVDPVDHAHLPLYVRAKRGVVERHLGMFAFPAASEGETGDSRRHVYSVRFTARELWGADAPERDNLFFSVWDSHIDSA